MKKLKNILYAVTGGWLLLCFLASMYFFIRQPHLRDYYYYGNIDPEKKEDEIRFDISKIVDGQVNGAITVFVRSKEAQKAIDNSEAYYVQYETLYGNPQIGDWIKVGNIEKRFDDYILKSDSDKILFSHRYDSKLFPFDQYDVWFDPNFLTLNKQRDVSYEKYIPKGLIKFNLPYSFDIKETREYMADKIKVKVRNGGFFFVVKRPIWFLWFIGGLLGLLLIPVLILLSADTKSLSIDIIALILSLISVRTFLLGEGKNIYIFDIIFCTLALISGLIIIYKLYRS